MPEDLLLLFTTRVKKMAVWKTTFVSEHLDTDQSQLTKRLHSLHVLPAAVLVIPTSSAARANHANSAKQYENSSMKRESFYDTVNVNKENIKN